MKKEEKQREKVDTYLVGDFQGNSCSQEEGWVNCLTTSSEQEMADTVIIYF